MIATGAVAIAALSAGIWGAADYCGGRAARQTSALRVTVLSQIYGLPALAVCVFAVPGRFHIADMCWGALAGVGGLFGIVLLYRGLSTGAMAVVAPTTAVTGAVVPVAVGLVTEDSPGALTLSGIACAILAIALVSAGGGTADSADSAGESVRQTQRTRLSGVKHPQVATVGVGLVAGALFGVLFVLLGQSSDDGGMWPLVALRGVSVPLGILLCVRRRVPLRSTPNVAWWLIAAGCGDIVANAGYLLAIRDGVLTVVAPIAALYPVSTVMLAVIVDRERVRAIQITGLALAAAALAITAT